MDAKNIEEITILKKFREVNRDSQEQMLICINAIHKVYKDKILQKNPGFKLVNHAADGINENLS